MKDSIIGKITVAVFSCVVFAFTLYSGRALMSYLFEEFYSGGVASAPGDLDDARFKDQLELAKDTLVEADRDDEAPFRFETADIEAPEALPREVESSLRPDDSEPVSEVSPVRDSPTREPRALATEDEDPIGDFRPLETDIDTLPFPDEAVLAGNNEEAESTVEIGTEPVIVDVDPGDDGVEDPTIENPPTDGPGDGGINLEIGDPDAPLVTGGLEIGDDVGTSLGVNLPVLSADLDAEIPDAPLAGEAGALAGEVGALAEEVVTATPPVDDLVTELEQRAARFLRPGGSSTPSTTRSRPREVAQPGRIYSGALAGSVTGMIGGMDAPTAPSSRVQLRPVTINGINASNPAVLNAAGATAILPSAQTSNPNTGAISGVVSGATSAVSGVTTGATSGAGAPIVSPGGQITLPTPGATGGAGVTLPPSTGGLPVPGGIGINAGGLDIKVNLGL